MTTEQAKVDDPCDAYVAMAEKWEKVDDLMGGTDRMRKVAIDTERWLPKMERESSTEYRRRVARSFLEPGFEDAIDKAVAKPFSRQVMLSGSEEVPEILTKVEADADYAGRSLHQFMRDWFQDAVEHGLSHCLVEYPTNPEGRVGRGRRPYLVHLPATAVFNWRSERHPETRQEILTHLRIKETRLEEDGEWGEKEVERIRVIDYVPGEGSRPTFRIFERSDAPGDNQEWQELPDEGGTLDTDGIPLVTLYTKRTGFMQAEPPLEKLADLNLEHWQSSSDQKNILHVARVPLLAEIGVDPDDPEEGQPKEVGANRRQLIPAGGDAKYVEHSGKAIGAGREDLKSIEDRMANVGHQIYVARTGNVTATGERIDEAKTSSQLREWISNAEAAARFVLEWVAKWESIGRASVIALPAELVVVIHSDFAVGAPAEEMPHLIALWQGGAISHETLLAEAKRRNLLLPSLDIEKEVEAVANEGPPGASFGAPPEEDDSASADAA